MRPRGEEALDARRNVPHSDFVEPLQYTQLAGEVRYLTMIVYERLCELSEAQLDKVICKMGVMPAILSGKQAPLATRAAELVHWAKHRGRLADLEEAVDEVVAPRLPIARDWWLSGVFLLAALTLIGGLLAAGVTDPKTWGLARTAADAAQLLVIVTILYYVWVGDTARFYKPEDDDAKLARRCVKQLVFYWENVWIVWLVFYGFEACRGVVERSVSLTAHAARYWGTASNVFNNFIHHHQSATFLLLFLMMIKPTLDEESHLHQKRRWTTLVWIGCLLLMMAQASIFMSLTWKGRFETHALAVELVAGFLTGLLTATCMGMFFGRLESRLLDVRPIELFLLYGYAGLQPLSPVLGALHDVAWAPAYLPTVADIVLKGIACSLKMGLFFVVRRQIKSGRLTYYMHTVRVSKHRFEEEWRSYRHERLGAPSSRGASLR